MPRYTTKYTSCDRYYNDCYDVLYRNGLKGLIKYKYWWESPQFSGKAEAWV